MNEGVQTPDAPHGQGRSLSQLRSRVFLKAYVAPLQTTLGKAAAPTQSLEPCRDFGTAGRGCGVCP